MRARQLGVLAKRPRADRPEYEHFLDCGAVAGWTDLPLAEASWNPGRGRNRDRRVAQDAKDPLNERQLRIWR